MNRQEEILSQIMILAKEFSDLLPEGDVKDSALLIIGTCPADTDSEEQQYTQSVGFIGSHLSVGKIIGPVMVDNEDVCRVLQASVKAYEMAIVKSGLGPLNELLKAMKASIPTP